MVAGGRKRLVELVFEFARQQGVDARALLDERQEVGPLDGHVALANHVAEAVVGDRFGGRDGGVEVVHRVREAFEFVVSEDGPVVRQSGQDVAEGGEVAGRVEFGHFVDRGGRLQGLAVRGEEGQQSLGDDLVGPLGGVGEDAHVTVHVDAGERLVQHDHRRVRPREFGDVAAVFDDLD